MGRLEEAVYCRRPVGRRLEEVVSCLVAEEAVYCRRPVGRRPEEAVSCPVAEEAVSCRCPVAAAVACDENTVLLASDKAASGEREWQIIGHSACMPSLPMLRGMLSTKALTFRVHRREEEEEA
mgnify:CR=1 FL=1